MYNDFKDRVFGILEPGDDDSKYFDPFIIGLIILNIFAVILESVSSIRTEYATTFHIFDVFSVAVFSIEYILRIWSCTSDPNFKNPIHGRMTYIFTPMAIVDLLAILPFYLPLLFPELRFLRALRIFRLLRILKLARYSESMHTFSEVARRTKGELGFLIFCIAILMVVASSVMFEAESLAQPDKFTSIPATMWWTVVTLTTVGYGDLYPITPIGKVVGSVSVLIGVCLVALITGILASGFSEVITEKKNGTTCPHCGKELHKKR